MPSDGNEDYSSLTNLNYTEAIYLLWKAYLINHHDLDGILRKGEVHSAKWVQQTSKLIHKFRQEDSPFSSDPNENHMIIIFYHDLIL